MGFFSKQRKLVGISLNGGEGNRLQPFTSRVVKPAVNVLCEFRIGDFTTVSLLNSHRVREIFFVTQYLAPTWEDEITNFFKPLCGWNRHMHIVNPINAGSDFQGTADAAFKAIDKISGNPDLVIVPGDHIVQINVELLHDEHLRRDSDFTIAVVPYPVEQIAGRFGSVELDDNMQIIGFQEKKEDPREIVQIPGRPGWAYASMGIYLTNADLMRTAQDRGYGHDFANDIIPGLLASGAKVIAWDFANNDVPGWGSFWADVGKIEDLFWTNMLALQQEPPFSMYSDAKGWAIPLRFVGSGSTKSVEGEFTQRNGVIVGSGSIINRDVIIDKSMLSPNVSVGAGSIIKESVIHPGAKIGKNVQLYRTMVDNDIIIPDNMRIGFDEKEDRRNGVTIDSGPNKIRVVGYKK
jgi:glucose-1-phosphate adenylyltransferase